MIGLIGAMDIEIDALKAKTEHKKSRIVSGIEFTEGILQGKSVVMAVCGIGKVYAAMCAQTMLLCYDVSCIINTGVAGSLTKELGIGDIAICKDAVQHDMDTTAIGDPKGLISGLNEVKMPADEGLANAMLKAAETLEIPHLLGTIASGDRFVATIEQKRSLAEEFGAIACEMEGAAIAQVCCVNKLPFGVIRAISDSLTDGSGMEYSEFRVLAAQLSNKMVLETLKLL